MFTIVPGFGYKLSARLCVRPDGHPGAGGRRRSSRTLAQLQRQRSQGLGTHIILFPVCSLFCIFIGFQGSFA
jgi:hypothetical protein